MIFRRLTGILRTHGRISKGALERSSSTYLNEIKPPKRRLPESDLVVLTLDPNKFTEKKQRRLHISNLQSVTVCPRIALRNQSSSVRLYYNSQAQLNLHTPYPPDSAAFLYYFSPPGKPRLAGELRFRVASSDDHASFESGSDLLKSNGRPWSRSLYQISKQYPPLYEKLREEGLVSDELNTVLSTFPPKNVPRCQLLYTLNDTFIVDFSFPGHRLFVITEQGVAPLKFLGPCFDQRQAGKNQTPYTGSALARFERSTLPEHKGTRTVVLRILKIINPVKCVIPLYDGHIRQPEEGELHRRTPTNATVIRNDLDQPSWSIAIDKPKSVSVRALQLLWDA